MNILIKKDNKLLEQTAKIEFEPSGTSWVDNGYRIVFNAREIRRGRQKGKFEVYYRKGYNYKKDYVEEIKCLTKTQS
jgi:hypothetical protein